MSQQNWNKSRYSRSSRYSRFSTYSRFSRSQIYQNYQNYQRFHTYRSYCSFCDCFHLYFTVPGDKSSSWYRTCVISCSSCSSGTAIPCSSPSGARYRATSHKEGGGSDSISCSFCDVVVFCELSVHFSVTGQFSS